MRRTEAPVGGRDTTGGRTSETLTAKKIAALNAVLAEATVECQQEGYHAHLSAQEMSRKVVTVEPGQYCTGHIARFPEFRADCNHAPRLNGGCDGTSYHVRAGSLEGGLAGLKRVQGHSVLDELADWAYWNNALPDDPMPSRPEILLKGLELVIEIAGLEEKSD